MNEQNVKNHTRIVVLWHLVTSMLILAILTGSILYWVRREGREIYPAVLLVGISLVLLFLWAYARQFALKAQDRAIRAEENFRHYLLTGKPHDSRLSLAQIIALRFAADEEMPALAKRAAAENLSQKQIKRAIRNWRADHHRV